VHLRRALLLFAIVLGMAALVASLSRPIDHRRRDAPPPRPGTGVETVAPRAAPRSAGELPRTVSFEASADQSRRLRAGQAATVEVAVSEAGSVDIPDMGLTAAADPVTPAQFDVLATRPGRYRLLFTPAGRASAEPAGKLVVTSRG
jgi:hypothetical protein